MDETNREGERERERRRERQGEECDWKESNEILNFLVYKRSGMSQGRGYDENAIRCFDLVSSYHIG